MRWSWHLLRGPVVFGQTSGLSFHFQHSVSSMWNEGAAGTTLTEPIAITGSPGPAGPERMRRAVAEYVTAVHAAYVRQARTLPPAVQGSMPLMSGGPLFVAAVGTRHLHVIATREPLGGGQRGATATVDGEAPPIRWMLSFFDPVVLPALGLVDEHDGPAFAEVRRLLGIGTHVYHLTLHPQSGLGTHHAEHTGAGLANAHSTAARELDTIIRAVPDEQAPLASELGGALTSGLPRAATLIARELAPDDPAVAGLVAAAADGAPVDPADVRRALLGALAPDRSGGSA
jgi:hypothetical protein